MKLPIANELRQDTEGRYSLNDIHQGMGGDDKTKPSIWLKLKRADELVECLINEGNHSNTYLNPVTGSQDEKFAVEELGYAYAMWINPSFALEVISTVDSMVQTATPVTDHIDPREIQQAILNLPEYRIKKDEMIVLLKE